MRAVGQLPDDDAVVDAGGGLRLDAARAAVRAMVRGSIGLLVASGCLVGLVVLLLHLSVRGLLIDAPLGWAVACGVGGAIGVVRWSRRVRALAGGQWWRGRAIVTRPHRWSPVRVNVLDPVDWTRQRTRLFVNRPVGPRGVHGAGKVKTSIWVAGRGRALVAVLGSAGPDTGLDAVVVAARPDDASRIGAGLLGRVAALVVARRRRLGAAGLVLGGLGSAVVLAVFANFAAPEQGDDATWQDGVISGLVVLTLVLLVTGLVTALRWHLRVHTLGRRNTVR